ncbi:PhzF family phenazine biosynthesis isomerase [Frigoribacterium faeni]|uniref:PhzF family phenazine biosynthesis isomerase n=1 Tax=Frigoribacterium faeni TaxID=145483 RepID=UPI00141AA4F6|nr:putative PhzF superfamily epimerase YddE/YHI9 [Frigoribacterium faeni]
MTRDPVLRLTAFPDGPDGGNPAGVVLDATALDAVDMQRIAAEVGYAETAFVVDRAVDGDERAVATRYFSPIAEVPFCGHATIATAVALAERRGPGAFRFETAVGPVVIDTTRDGATRVGATHDDTTRVGTGDGTSGGGTRGGGTGGDGPGGDGPGHGEAGLRAAFTSVEPRTRPLPAGAADELLGLLGLGRDDLDPAWPLDEAFAGNWHPVVALASRRVFDAFSFDPGAVRELMDRQGWTGTVTVLCTEGVDLGAARAAGQPLPAVEARNLFPVGTVVEDPATGSAAAALGAYLRAAGLLAPPARFVVRQGRHVGRPSLLTVDVPPAGGVTVSGTADVIVG